MISDNSRSTISNSPILDFYIRYINNDNTDNIYDSFRNHTLLSYSNPDNDSLGLLEEKYPYLEEDEEESSLNKNKLYFTTLTNQKVK